MNQFDDIVIGAGMAGLAAANLLGLSGRRVLLLEAHDVPGGYAHTFEMRGFRFCAQVHYIFGCGEGGTVDTFLREIGVREEVPFLRLDPEGFDHVVVAGDRVKVPNGLLTFQSRLIRRYPQWRTPIVRYFEAVEAVARELSDERELPSSWNPLVLAGAALRYPNLIRYRTDTLSNVYDRIGMPPHLRAVLAGQSGDYLLPPEEVSFLLHVALVHGYDQGAYYPKKHFGHMVETIAGAFTRLPGCVLKLGTAVSRIHTERGRVTAVETQAGERFTASRYVSNVDPTLTMKLAGEENFSREERRQWHYDYSCATFTMYLGVTGMDLREHGFGSHNVWHYPHSDIGRMYKDQLLRHDLSDPWLFMSTPSLHSDEPGICPPGHQILEIATACDHGHMSALRERDRRAYNVEKKKIRDRILDLVSDTYAPKLRDHLSIRVTGTPATNARFCRAPQGNSYGASLTPANVTLSRRPKQTSLGNLWLANATAGMPSVSGAIGSGVKLAREMCRA